MQERNAELREALEHQTATAEVLGIISRSPTDVQPVLDAIVESAARVCGIDDVVLRLREGNAMVPRAHFGPMPIVTVSRSVLMSHSFAGCASMARSTFPTSARRTISQCGSSATWRTFLAVPLRQQEELIGALIARRTEVRPFTPAQIKLLETFADQAVIAIENVRLFQELKESLEQQTATSEILGCHRQLADGYSAGPGYGRGKCGATLRGATMLRSVCVEGDMHAIVALLWTRSQLRVCEANADQPRVVTGRAIVDRQTIHVHDLPSKPRTEFPEVKMLQQRAGSRTVSRHAVAARGSSDRGDHHSADGGSSIHGQANQAARNLRRPSGDRHRERPLVQRIR